MSYLILLFFFFALYHLIYESIILPSVRLHYRNKLFSLRDEVRRLKLEELNETDKAALTLLHDGISTILNRVHLITIELQHEIEKEINEDKELNEMIKERYKILDQSTNKDVIRISYLLNTIVNRSILFNAGGWFIYIVPIAIVIFIFEKISDLAKQLILIPPTEVDRLIPENHL